MNSQPTSVEFDIKLRTSDRIARAEFGDGQQSSVSDLRLGHSQVSATGPLRPAQLKRAQQFVACYVQVDTAIHCAMTPARRTDQFPGVVPDSRVYLLALRMAQPCRAPWPVVPR